jgi:hypothetical protein
MTDHIEVARSRLKALARIVFAPSTPSRGGIRAVRCFAALFVASLVVAVAGRMTGIEALALSGGYGVIFFGVGAAPFQLHPDLDLYARITGAVLVGLSVLLGVGALMGDVHGLWHPVVAAALVVTVAFGLHLIGLTRIEIGRSSAELGSESLGAYGMLAAVERGIRASRSVQTSLLLTLVGTMCWLAAALSTHDPNPGFWGMLKTVGPLWYLGPVLLIIGFAIGRRNELCGAAAAISFGLATTLTPALVYGAPRNQTAAKQMSLTEYLLQHHHIAVTAGIYQAYSALFSGIAWLAQLLGVHGMVGGNSLLGLATFWPVVLLVPRVVVLRLLAGRLLSDTGRRWTAVMLVLLVDSLGDDYFSPQSVGYVLVLGALAIAVKGATARHLGRTATFFLLLLVGLALGPTHELSPFVAAGALIVLAIFGQAPYWAWLPIALPAFAWAGVVHKAIGQNFSFAQLFDLSNFRPPQTAATPGLSRLPIVALQSHALLAALLILIALAAIGFFTNFRRPSVWGYGLCPIVGLSLIAINPYGNEGIFRATLFAIPWMAVLAMQMPPPATLRPILQRPAVLSTTIAGLFLALAALFLVAAYAMDGPSVIRTSDLKIFNYLARQPTRNAFVVGIGPQGDVTGYPAFAVNYTGLTWDQVATVPILRPRHPTMFNLTAFADKYGIVTVGIARRPGPLYVYWSRTMLLYSQAYGLESPAELRTWLKLLRKSPSWRLVDHVGDSYLFELRDG